MALLVLLLFFHLILDINSQYDPQPRLFVSPEVLTVSGSVYLHCNVPHSVKVSQCYFYPERDDKNTKLSPCQLSVTGSELIRWTGRSSPGTLHIICYYTVDKSWIQAPSSHSLPAPVTVLNQKPVLSVTHDDQPDEFRLVCEIPESESVRADFSCNLYTGENPQPYRTQTSQKRQSGNLVCIFKAERNDLFRRLQSVKSDEVSCDYSLISDPTARSLMSDKYNMIRFFSSTTQASISTEKSTAYSSFKWTQPSPKPVQPSRRSTQPSPKPAKSSPKPAQLSPKPTQLSPKPTQLSPKPTQLSPKPTQPSPKPAQPSPKPAQPSPKPAKSSPKPAQLSPKPTQLSPKPAQPSPKPAQPSPKPTQSSSESSSVTTEDPAAGSLLTILPVTGVCVLLVGLVSICVCMCIRKKKTQRCKLNTGSCDHGVMMSMFDINKSGSEAAESYCSSVRSPSQPSDPRGDKKTLDDVIYTQVTIKTKDPEYSLP